MRSGPPIRSRSPSRRSGRTTSTRPSWRRWSATSSTSALRRSSGTWISVARSTGRRPRTGTSGARASPGRRPIAPTTSAGRSSSERLPPAPGRLAGPVDVCVDIPKLSLDRPFTYLLPEDADAGVGSLVSVPFHGRAVAGWVLGLAAEVPSGKLLPIRKVRSEVRFFDEQMLLVLRWVSERYIAPLSVAIRRSYPPRVAGEEGVAVDAGVALRRARVGPGGNP